MRRPRNNRRGLTLIELTIALAVAALAVSISIVSINALTDADLKSSAVEITGAIKFSYDRSIMEKRTQRIGMDIDKGLWWIEYTDDRYALAQERATGNTGAQSPGLDGAEEKKVETIDDFFSAFDEPDAEVKMAMQGTTRFMPDPGAGKPRTLPGNVRFSKIWTGHQEEPFTEGVAYLHFFRSGWTEPAQIELTDGADEYITLKVFPLTGRVRMYTKPLEEPEVEDYDGREEGDL